MLVVAYVWQRGPTTLEFHMLLQSGSFTFGILFFCCRKHNNLYFHLPSNLNQSLKIFCVLHFLFSCLCSSVAWRRRYFQFSYLRYSYRFRENILLYTQRTSSAISLHKFSSIYIFQYPFLEDTFRYSNNLIRQLLLLVLIENQWKL